tara:strand:- start:159 stop:377 length:219 start_codon:yes stop_codon:yes gene_type:complete
VQLVLGVDRPLLQKDEAAVPKVSVIRHRDVRGTDNLNVVGHGELAHQCFIAIRIFGDLLKEFVRRALFGFQG